MYKILKGNSELVREKINREFSHKSRLKLSSDYNK